MAQPHRIVEVPSYRQLRSKSLLAIPQDASCLDMRSTAAILSRIAQLHKWRSSLRPDDKCHPMPHITITTANATRKLRRDSLEPAFIGGRSVQSGN
jgi:hypothetical protein